MTENKAKVIICRSFIIITGVPSFNFTLSFGRDDLLLRLEVAKHLEPISSSENKASIRDNPRLIDCIASEFTPFFYGNISQNNKLQEKKLYTDNTRPSFPLIILTIKTSIH